MSGSVPERPVVTDLTLDRQMHRLVNVTERGEAAFKPGQFDADTTAEYLDYA